MPDFMLHIPGPRTRSGGHTSVPLGEPATIRARLDAALPGICWRSISTADEWRGEFAGPPCCTLMIRHARPVTLVEVTVPAPWPRELLQQLATGTGWTVQGCGAGTAEVELKP